MDKNRILTRYAYQLTRHVYQSGEYGIAGALITRYVYQSGHFPGCHYPLCVLLYRLPRVIVYRSKRVRAL